MSNSNGLIWTFNYNTDTFSFTATDYTVDRNHVFDSIVIGGSGLASITGLDDTNGTFNLSVNEQGANFTFSSSTAVPDESTALALLGLGLAGLGAIARRRK